MRRLCFVLCIILLLSGCQGYKELNELQVVAGLYLDVEADGTVRATAETISFSNGKEMPAVYTATGMGLRDCLTGMMASCGKELYLSHAEVIVISRAYADTRLRELTEQILHDNEVRFTTAIVVSSADTAAELLDGGDGEDILSYKLSELLKNSENTGYSVPKESYIAIRELYGIGKTTVLPTVSAKDGELRTTGAVAAGDEGLLFLDEDETVLLNLLTGTLKRGSIGFSSDGITYSVAIRDCQTARSCCLTDGIMTYTVDASLSVETFMAYDRERLTASLRRYLGERVHRLFDRLVEAELDAVGASRLLVGTHPEQYRPYEGTDVFQDGMLSFSVKIDTGESVP